MHIEQMEGDAVAAVVADAENLAALLGSMYRELQELGKFLVRASSLLADLHQLLIPMTVRFVLCCRAFTWRRSNTPPCCWQCVANVSHPPGPHHPPCVACQQPLCPRHVRRWRRPHRP